MIPKVLSTLCSKHISYLADKHNMLPSTQFGGHPGYNTTDAMLLVVHKIKNSWRHSKVVAALVLMNFPRLHRDHIPGTLSLAKPNPDGSVSSSLIHPVSSYKYLGVIFNPKLGWSLHQMKALMTASFWSSHIWRLSKLASGVLSTGMKQLYSITQWPFRDSPIMWMCGTPTYTNQ
jgi:hypothetical protein